MCTINNSHRRRAVDWNNLSTKNINTTYPLQGGAAFNTDLTLNLDTTKWHSMNYYDTRFAAIGGGGGGTYTAGRLININSNAISFDTATAYRQNANVTHAANILFDANGTRNVGSSGTSAGNVYTVNSVVTNFLPLSTAGFTFFNNGAGTKLMQVFNNGHVMIQPAGGTFTDVASSAFTVNSTTAGVLAPRMTTAQRTAISTPAEGLMVYDTDLHKLYVWDGTLWQAAW
jgi:hypothetical protein